MTEFFGRIMKADSSKKRYFAVFTAAFWGMALLIYCWFFVEGRTLIWREDGWSQHYRALAYYGEYLRGILGNLLFEHKLVVPEWDFYVGEGSDVLNTFHYYVIGDPLAALSVFVPLAAMPAFYSLMMVVRMYLAGLSFSAFCFSMNQKNCYGILTGTLSYSFCAWALCNASRHPYFLNPMIYLPLLLIGVERIFRREKPYLFIVMVMLSGLSNIYFFYMIAIATAVYVIVRAIVWFRGDIEMIGTLIGKVAGFAIVGALLAGVILVPVVYMMLSDARVTESYPLEWKYALQYYLLIPANLTVPEPYRWLCMGYPVTAVPALFLLFRRRGKNIVSKILLILCGVCMLIPAFGQVFNGLSYVTNRWSWIMTFVVAYILVAVWDDLIVLQEADKRFLVIAVGIVAFLGALEYVVNRPWYLAVTVLMVLAILVAVGMRGEEPSSRLRKEGAVLVLTMTCLVLNGFFYYSPFGERKNIDQCVKADEAAAFLDNPSRIIAGLSDDAYTRFASGTIDRNSNVLNGVSSTQFYWSLTNPSVSGFRDDMEMSEIRYSIYRGYEGRTQLMSLAGVKYLWERSSEGKILPCGLEKIETNEQGDYYENPYALPFGYCCDQYVLPEQWDRMSALQRQQVMMKAVYLTNKPAVGVMYEGEVTEQPLEYQISYSSGVTYRDGKVAVSREHASITLTFEGQPNAETYLSWKGLDYESSEDNYWESAAFKGEVEKVPLRFRASTGEEKSAYIFPGHTRYTTGRKDFVVNMGYHEVLMTSVTITFPKKGSYFVDDFSILSVPLDSFASDVAQLSRESLQNIRIENNAFSGEITLDAQKLLCVQIPYGEGWSAFVDGARTRLLVANGRYLGLELEPGQHEIRLEYHTPYKRAGFMVTLLGLFALLGIVAVERYFLN